MVRYPDIITISEQATEVKRGTIRATGEKRTVTFRGRITDAKPDAKNNPEIGKMADLTHTIDSKPFGFKPDNGAIVESDGKRYTIIESQIGQKGATLWVCLL